MRGGLWGVLLLLGACGSSVVASPQPSPPSDRIVLGLGETQPIPGAADHRVTFVRVVAERPAVAQSRRVEFTRSLSGGTRGSDDAVRDGSTCGGAVAA